MNQIALVKRAIINLLRTAARDPVWAVVALVVFPLRYAKVFVLGVLSYAFVTLTVAFGIDYLTLEVLGSSEGGIVFILGNCVFSLFAVVLFFRMLFAPLIIHFGSTNEHTHGTARFASKREIKPFTRSGHGLLIGRAPSSGRLIRYDGPAHLLTMAPTRSGKGLGRSSRTS